MPSSAVGVAPHRRRPHGLRAWIPPQHGVWAMLLLPYLSGLQYGRCWLDLPLLIMWLSGWLFTHHALLGVKTSRWARYMPQMAAYASLSAVCAVPVFVVRPALLGFVPAFVVLFAVNVVAARIGQDRATGNGIASVTMASLMAMIVPATAGEPFTDGLPAALITWLYLVGTVVYVKTMIRERGSGLHYGVSVAYHAVALGVSAAVNVWFLIPFTWLLARAVVLARHRIRVIVVGLTEVTTSVALLGTIVAVL